jgi:hypothetical protein
VALKNSLDRLAADPDLDAFLGHVLLEIAQQLGTEDGNFWLYDAFFETLSLEMQVEHDCIQHKQQIRAPKVCMQMATVDVPIWEALLHAKQPLISTQEYPERSDRSQSCRLARRAGLHASN